MTGMPLEISSPASSAELLERARALVPAIKERGRATEEARKLHPDTIRELHETGLFRVVQPARIGGSECDYRTMIEATVELGRGCGSTAWVFVNLSCHHWMLGMWPEAAQDRIWDENPDTLIASSMIYPAGRAIKVAGGYELTGRWPFASGVDWADWVMLGGMVQSDEATPDPNAERRMFIVHKDDYTVLETWDTSGLCGTGSHDVTVEGAFIPTEMTLEASAATGGDTPGSAVNPNVLYKLPVLGLFPHIIAAPIVGMAEGACETFVEANKSAVSTYNASKIASHPTIQIKVTDTAAAVEAARMLIFANCDEATRTFEAGGVCSEEQKHRWRRDAAFGAKLCAEAVEKLYKASGGRAAYKDNPMQRYYRDVSVGISHISMSWDAMGAEFGKYRLGLGGNPFV